jgi:large subunit ribosomal protein L6
MSRIGKQPIPIETGIKVNVDDGRISVEGPKGKLAQTLPPGITAEIEGQQVLVRRRDDSKRQRSLHGLSRALLANAVHGVSKGFEKRLEIHGVGYRAELAGRTLKFSLGYSHPIDYAIPEGIDISVQRNLLTVSGCDRQQVGQVAAIIRAFRPPDVYKLKGIRYSEEQLRKKAGKTGAS